MLDYIRRNIRYVLPWNWRAAGKALYRRFSGSGIIYDTADLGMATLLPAKKIEATLAYFQPKSVLDVGCGTGASLRFFLGKGIEATGVEASAAAIRAADMGNSIVKHDLRRPLDLGRRFDLVWCFEVAEHLHERDADTFVMTLVRHSDVIVMSAAPPGQGGEGHLNEQPKSYWIDKFAKQKFNLHSEATNALCAVAEFYSENMMVFHRASM